MAAQDRDKASKNIQRPVKPSGKLFFINGKLVRVIAANRASNIIYFFNIIDQKEQTMLLSDFKKHRKRAYTTIDAGRILNRSREALKLYCEAGLIKPPVGTLANGERSFTRKSYYSEDDIFEIHKVMQGIHKGRPRKDGKIVNNTLLTEKEVRAKMGEELVLYTRTKDGRFIPVWEEQTY